MNDILTVLTQNILPILIVASFGYGLQRWKVLDKRTLSTVVLYILSPCLVFSSLVSSDLPTNELAELVLFTVLVIGVMGVLGLIATRILRLSRQNTAAFLILVMFVNGGNFGLTLAFLRYGNAGVSTAVIYFATSTFLTYTVGVFIASMGRLNPREALMRLVRVPAVYAPLAAVLVVRFQIPVPTPLLRAIDVAGAGAIPVLLLMLGMQMADFRGPVPWRLAAPAISMRLLVGPLVGLAVATFLGLHGLGRSTSIIQSSMPPAVFAVVLAAEFGLPATAVTSIVILATLISPFTIATIISLLGL